MTVRGQIWDVVIVGAGHAGAQAALALRQLGHAGTILMLGDESEPPYERPPLSKEYLKGERDFARMLLRPIEFWSDRSIDLVRGEEVVSVDPAAKSVKTVQGNSYRYRTLIWAAGGRARRLSCPGGDAAGVHAVRTRRDVDDIRKELPAASHVAVIGGGFVGLEVAAGLRQMGKSVTLLEAREHLLSRVAGPDLARFYEAEHRARGVDVRLGVAVAALSEKAGRVSGVVFDDGTEIAADLVVVGIGIVPSVAPLLEAGAAGANGIDVDRQCASTLPDIYVVGDCAAQENPFSGNGPIRIESIQNARDQAMAAARSILGLPYVLPTVPTFWSNQYDLKLQSAGLCAGYDEARVGGDPAMRSFSISYLREGRPIAVDCVNNARDFTRLKSEIRPG